MKTTIRIAIVVSKFNRDITGSLLDCCLDRLRQLGLGRQSTRVVWVPGAFELPFAVQQLAATRRYKAVIALGCVIKGQTSHDQHIASWASMGVGMASFNTGVPCLFGVLTPNNERQARARAKKGPLNRGAEVAEAAIEMINFAKENR